MSNYKIVIGLEMHCELKSNSKVFSSAKNAYSDIANEFISPVDIALPGTLPVVNKKCVKDALMMSMILNCKLPEYMYFDRKNYYYPDLPKGYQITQVTDPVGINGHLDIEVAGNLKRVDIHDIHLEEDTASLDHGFDTSLLNYNRAGVPLLELVTEPCLNSPEEAVAFLEYMRSIYKYTDISEADTKKGQIRCDVNVSIMNHDDTEFGTRVEIKNINSFSSVYDAIVYEVKRQSELKDAGRYNEVEQETRRWDDESLTTKRMRSKEDALDYKYFVDPNLPKFKLDITWIEQIRNEIPTLPLARKNKYINDYNLSDYDANVLIKEKSLSDYFEKCIDLGIEAKTASNWLTTQIMGYLNNNELEIKDLYLTPEMLKTLIDTINNGTISSKQAKEIFFKVVTEKRDVKEFISKDNAQISDETELTNIINSIIENNKIQVEQYKNGKTNLFDFFVGQVMKETKGKANPVMTKELIKKILD